MQRIDGNLTDVNNLKTYLRYMYKIKEIAFW